MMYRVAWTWGLGLMLALVGHGVCWAQADARLLFVGNSYTYGNQLDQLVKQISEAGVPGWKQVYATRQAPGGYRWEQHAKDADGTNGDTPLRQFLVTGTSSQYKWDFVVLQEQSQIPGFPQSGVYWRGSLAGLKVLHGLILAKGAKTVLMMTWGRRKGDAMNQARFPDYKTMQRHLADGYRAYAAQASTTSSKILLAPVGLAFEKIYDDIKAAGQDPLNAQSAFSKLYVSDDSHPSLQGSFLAACVIYATITGRDPRQVSWAPAGISAAEKQLYQAAAWAVTKPAGTSEPTSETTRETGVENVSDVAREASREALGEPSSEPTPERSQETQADASPTPERVSEAGDAAAPDKAVALDGPGTSADTNTERTGGEPAPSDSGGGDVPAGQGCCQSGADVPLIGLFCFFWLWLGWVRPGRRLRR